MPETGFEPASSKERRFLRPLRLPFRHSGLVPRGRVELPLDVLSPASEAGAYAYSAIAASCLASYLIPSLGQAYGRRLLVAHLRAGDLRPV